MTLPLPCKAISRLISQYRYNHLVYNEVRFLYLCHYACSSGELCLFNSQSHFRSCSHVICEMSGKTTYRWAIIFCYMKGLSLLNMSVLLRFSLKNILSWMPFHILTSNQSGGISS
jgi:hypothetical protein